MLTRALSGINFCTEYGWCELRTVGEILHDSNRTVGSITLLDVLLNYSRTNFWFFRDVPKFLTLITILFPFFKQQMCWPAVCWFSAPPFPHNLYNIFILSALWQVHSFFQSEFSAVPDLVLPLFCFCNLTMCMRLELEQETSPERNKTLYFCCILVAY